jgi:hypothetical protein
VYVLAENLPFAFHRIRVYKRTESSCSLTGWTNLRTDGNFCHIAKRNQLKIEFYGDSITAGNGVEGNLGDNFLKRAQKMPLLVMRLWLVKR